MPRRQLKDYGLDKPYLTLRLVPTGKDDVEHELLVGKPVDKEAGRFAKLAKAPGVFVLSDKAVAAFDRSPLDFLDKKLLALDTKSIQKVRSAGPAPFVLQAEKRCLGGRGFAGTPFTAEDDAVKNALRPWANLKAERIAAYGPKIDWATYGLDKAAQTVVVTVKGEKDKTTEHQVVLGKEADKGMRFRTWTTRMRWPCSSRRRSPG